MLVLKQWFHLLQGPQQVHVHTDHKSLRYRKTCPRTLTPRQARWFQFLEEYNLTVWYVPGLENPAAEACSCLVSRQLMDIQNATHTRAFVVYLVENCVSPEEEDVDEFLHVLEDSFSHDEVWLQPYDHLYVSLRSGGSGGKGPDVDGDAKPALRFDTEPLPSSEALGEDSHQSTVHLNDAGNEVPDMSTDTDDPPDIDMDRPLRVNFGREPRYAATLTKQIRRRRHRDGTLQPILLPKVGPNTPYPLSHKGAHRRVH